MSNFVLILPLLYYWPFGGSVFVLVCMSKKKEQKQTIASCWFHKKLSFYDSHDFTKKTYSTHKLCADFRY